MIPLNQTYHHEQTFREHPRVKELYNEYHAWAAVLGVAEVVNPITGQDKPNWAGRVYDHALTLAQVNFKDKVVCELGARLSVFPSYLTRYAKVVHASDGFIGFQDTGDRETWYAIWRQFASAPERLVCEVQDMRDLGYLDNFFDVVTSFSTIEHIHPDGDIAAAREMGRVCKPGGVVVIGTDMAAEYRTRTPSSKYDELAIFERIVEPSGCVMREPCDFSLDGADMMHVNLPDREPFTACLFVLDKPEVPA